MYENNKIIKNLQYDNENEMFSFIYNYGEIKGALGGVSLKKWDTNVLLESGKYTLLMFLTSLATQIFASLDNILIGAFKGPSYVTTYSVALLFFSMFQSLSAGIASVMLPTVTNVLALDNGMEKVSNVIIKAGKAQFVLLGAALTGFICIGKDFINVWLGEGFQDVYRLVLILIIPSMFELCINVCHSILRAENRLGFRTGVVIVSAILNAVFTIILLSSWSYFGAAVATACSYIICSLFVMNIYYTKVIGLPMIKIYKEITMKVSICLLISGTILFVFSKFVNGSWNAIVANILLFCVIYAILMLSIGLNDDEKSGIPFLKRFISQEK